MDNQPWKKSPSPWKYGRSALLAVVIIAAYIYSFRVTELDLPRLVTDFPKAVPILQDFLTPDVLARGEQTESYVINYPVPCGSGQEAEIPDSGPRIVPSVPCSDPKTTITVEGFDLRPDTKVQLRWLLPDGRRLRSARATTDGNGHFNVEVEIRPIVAAKEGNISQLEAELQWESTGLMPSEALKITFAKIVETVFMALMATTFACLVAFPVGFLGARNIMGTGPVGTVVYYIARTIFNLMRSIEALVMAVMFAIWLGFGPFAGVMAMTVVTVASLSKLFSEAIESIDPGPMEAIVAAGGNRLQAIVYAVFPQVIPPFIAFAIYHWDINVRISTIIGFVGGGGIGLQLQTWINQLAYNKAGTAVWAIVIVVTILDNLSSQIRKRLV
ncbi:MAG: phosphonate ABC transporter, permease protein PhnE [Chloroflexi bacterium]|nr:MAG: phosphonate ABC transporter, permease protein PhnE [Chloroflexota bacterium]